MIQNFKDKGLKLLFEKGDRTKIKSDLVRKIENILTMLNATKEIRDMNAPGFNLHQLKGNKKGIWSVTVKKNWRITFRFENEDVYNVNFEDYH